LRRYIWIYSSWCSFLAFKELALFLAPIIVDNQKKIAENHKGGSLDGKYQSNSLSFGVAISTGM
jgi:hypothetical protein